MEKLITEFKTHLIMEEKSAATVEKYMRDCRAFFVWAKSCDAGENGSQQEMVLTKEMVMNYKQHLVEQGYAVRSINSMLASLNSFLSFCDRVDCKVKNVRAQRQIYMQEDKELTKEEYIRLVLAAKENPRLEMLLQTICATGIRVSELRYFTVEAVEHGEIRVSCKNKTRTILIPRRLKEMLLDYATCRCISQGPIFVTSKGQLMNRSNIWKEMKELCERAQVLPSKVFPHNLRKLFAKTFYSMGKDIAKLSDVLGHSSIETTRIYIMTTGHEHQKMVDQLNLTV